MTLSGEGSSCADIAEKCVQFLKVRPPLLLLPGPLCFLNGVGGAETLGLCSRQVEDIHLTDISVTPSTDLIELQYQIIRTLKWRRRQMVQLRQNDGKKFWVDLTETSSNTSSIIIQVRRPAGC